ncbi:DUF6146 family protein [Moheibacter sediminis]|uniref:Uncharacterized protein n=1 Tax=Moheibacter sediminis TaxID=1434700 RepID=A0A1W1ZA96_9FLAO|nr:DUF6146 family protein [Moheibacter sediminis]SMC45272.1 hypothetical protein SAMN06296427_102301 [Moheibacter sediminis]
MKNLLYIIICCQLFSNCTTKIPPVKEENTLSFEKNDEDEYDIIVLDPQYETYLVSIARPMNFYSESYYKNRNQIYVNEWNLRHSQPFNYDPDFYALRIDYESNKDYGINLEYKLYNFFEFIKWKYKVDLYFGR